VKLYRFGSDPTRTAEEEFNGVGGLKAEGRWHVMGTPAVYAATSEPLALLEKLVHRKAKGPLVYPLYLADVPDELLRRVGSDELPEDWRSIFPPRSTRLFGSDWLKSNEAVGLLVPSVLIQGQAERNCLINPTHPEFSKVQLFG
jgi:RES domain-containing protein